MTTKKTPAGQLGAHPEPPALSAHKAPQQIAAPEEAATAAAPDPIFENSRKGNLSGAMKWGLAAMLVLAAITAVAVIIGLSHHKNIDSNATAAYTTPGGSFVLHGGGDAAHGFIPVLLTPDPAAMAGTADNNDTATAIGPDGRTRLIAIADPTTQLVYFFDVNKSSVAENATLNEFIKRISGAGDNVTVVAYTDLSGSRDYNTSLSKKRARALGDYLKAHGVDPSRLRVNGRGATDAFGSPELDRRAELHIN